MAKRTASATEHKIEEFAEDLRRMLGNARGKAEKWLGQRQHIVNQLKTLRDEATKLLSDLGHEAERVVRRGRRAASKELDAATQVVKRTRRKMSAAAKAKISAAQKKRWAKQRATEKK